MEETRMLHFRNLHHARAVRRALCATALAIPVLAAAAGPQSRTFSVVGSPTRDQANQLQAPLVEGPDGLLYGAGMFGGAYTDGSVFRVEADGSITVLHSFNGKDGYTLPSGLIVGADGCLYGLARSSR
jgi:uncharacterized repeat protein (TIGR03803 family)